MITYELAKQLKEAGFIQRQWIYAQHFHPTEKNSIGEHMIYFWKDICDLKIQDSIYIPEIDELIEACGDEFVYLSKEHDRWDAKSKTQIISKMASPEEAVAKLWLTLNKK